MAETQKLIGLSAHRRVLGREIPVCQMEAYHPSTAMSLWLGISRAGYVGVFEHSEGSQRCGRATAYTGPGGLQLLWRVLDEAFSESEAELFERADKELEKYRRAPGESIAHYLAEMRRLRAQYSRVDPDTKLSDRAWAQKL